MDRVRSGDASWSAINGFAAAVLAGLTLLVAGALADGPARVLLWTLAVAIDYAGPAWLTRERLRGLQQVAVAHFAERYSLFVIICLGEPIVAIGLSADERPLDAGLAAGVALGLLTTIGLWWTYFDHFAGLAESRLRTHDDPVLAAADGYSYLHLVIGRRIVGGRSCHAGARRLVHDRDARALGEGRHTISRTISPGRSRPDAERGARSPPG